MTTRVTNRFLASLSEDALAKLGIDSGTMPTAEWQDQEDRYKEFHYYFAGDFLSERLDGAPDNPERPADKYPLQVNLTRVACETHANALLGDYTPPSVLEFHAAPIANYKGTTAEVAQKRAKYAEWFWRKVWENSRADGQALSAAIDLAVYGGSVWKVRWAELLTPQIRIDRISPQYFYPVWDPSDYHRLSAALVAYEMTAKTARLRHGVKLDQKNDGDQVLYVEHWDTKSYKVMIEDEIAQGPEGPIAGVNIFKDPRTGEGIIPFEYIPRRRDSGFYGNSIVEGLIGLTKEINARSADFGDAISDDSHRIKWMKNCNPASGQLRMDRNGFVNLGNNVEGMGEPEIGAVESSGLPESSLQFLEFLLQLLRVSAFTPPVAYGEDEGSQRSALTISMRMWPLIADIKGVRIHWIEGMVSLFEKASIIFERLTRNDEAAAPSRAIPQELIGKAIDVFLNDFRFWVDFAPVQPRDREQLVNETILLAQSGLMSRSTALRLLNFTQNIEKEVIEIKSDLHEKQMIEQKIAAGAPQMLKAPLAESLSED